jgi:hypothetical protein
MLPFLREGSKGIAELTKDALSYGVATDKDYKTSQRFTRQQGELENAVAGVRTEIGEKLTPALGNAEEAMAHFLRANKDGISSALTDWTTYFEAFAIYLTRNWIKRIGTVLLETLPRMVSGAAAGLFVLLDPNQSIQSGSGEHNALVNEIKKMNAVRAKEGLPPLAMPPNLSGNGDATSNASYKWDQDHQDKSGAQADANVNAAKKFFLGQGWTPAQTAGILANAAQESGFDPTRVGDHGTSRGLMQWHNDRATQMYDWTTAHGLDPNSLKGQLAFTQWDLTQGPNKATGNLLKQQTDATASSGVITRGYERPADVDGESYRRGLMAPQFLGVPVDAPAAPDAGLSETTTKVLTDLRNHPGVQGGTGTAPPADNTTTVKGSANVNVSFKGLPPGTRTSANTDGDLFAQSGPVRIQKGSVGDGMVA